MDSSKQNYKFEDQGKPSYRTAQKLMFKENYILALPYLKKVVTDLQSKGKNSDKATVELGICYLVSKSPNKGIRILDSISTKAPKAHPDLLYWQAVGYHLTYQFDKAIEYYKKAIVLPSSNKDERVQIRKKIFECESAKSLMNNKTIDLEIVNLGTNLNTPFSEHSPTISTDSKTIFYTSRKNIDGQKATFSGEYFEDIYLIKIDSDFVSIPESQSNFNTKEHDASSQITNNDNTMLMYRSTKSGDIYISNKTNGKWSKPTPIKGLNSMSYESSAFLTQDGNRIYFSSNKYSDQADLDIYYMDKDQEGKWGRPKSIGSHINTAYNEDGIYITNDGKSLYFSSDGLNSMGGFDIFKSDWDGTKWGKPVNLGYPINTPGNDLYYSISPNNKYSIFCSYREGGLGMRDLYLAVPTNKITTTFLLTDSSTNAKINMPLQLHIQSTKTNSTHIVTFSNGVIRDTLNNNDKYLVFIKEGDKVIKTDTLNLSKNLKTGLYHIKSFTINYLNQDSTATPKETNIFEEYGLQEDTDTIIINSKIILGNIYFEHNQSKIQKKYIPVLQEIIKAMKANKAINIELSGYSDENGDLEYNRQLSELRAHNVYDYITTRGISSKRVIYKGHGLPPHGTRQNTSTPHHENRRVSLKILK